MYASRTKNSPVKTPARNETGYPVFLKNGYCYWVTRSYYDALKGHSADTRVCIGKAANESRSSIYPSPGYFKIFGADGNASETAESDTKAPAPAEESPDVAHEISIGAYALLIRALKKIGALDALKKAFPECFDGIIALTVHAVCTGGEGADLLPFWVKRNYSGLSVVPDDDLAAGICAQIAAKPKAAAGFFKAFLEKFLRRFKPQASSRVAVFNSPFPLSAVAPRDLLNTAMIMADPLSGMPLFWTPKACFLQNPDEAAQALGFDGSLFLADDLKIGSAYRAGGTIVLLSNEHPLALSVASRCADELKLSDLHCLRGLPLCGMRIDLATGECSGFNQAYVYYDPRAEALEREMLEEQCAFSDVFFAEFSNNHLSDQDMNFGKLNNQTPSYGNTAQSSPSEIGASQDNDGDSLRYSGMFVIASNVQTEPEEMLKAFKVCSRSCSLFQKYAEHFACGLKKNNGHGGAGALFCAGLALLIHQSAAYCTKKLMSGTDTSLMALLREIGECRIRIGSDADAVFSLSERQKEILRCVSLSPEDLNSWAGSLKAR